MDYMNNSKNYKILEENVGGYIYEFVTVLNIHI